MNRRILVPASIIALMLLVLTLAPSCMSGNSQTGKSFLANLGGASEVPPVTTQATGQAVFNLSPDGASMTFTLTVSNINDVTASHIHLAAAGVNGPVVVPLLGVPKPGPFSGVLAQGTITSASLGGLLAGKTVADLVTEMEAGRTYVNVHTTLNPGGE